MIFGYLTLFTALIISLSAAVYSILGLTAIFAAAFWPIVVLGGSLEFGKIVTTLWLHKYWDRAEIQYKVYLCAAVAILMLLTSMGVFGFLSKAHSDQSLVSGDVGAKIAIYDEKIKISRENIDANRRALKQMDEAVDQVMARSTTEGGADKAVAIRRGQSAERKRLLGEIEVEQKKITALNEERAPIAAENRKVEAEVGPIKYIAALIYGDNPDANILEKSVRWVIILIVVVFDPLALTLLLAATKTLEWERGINIFAPKKNEEKYEQDDGALTDDQIDRINRMAMKIKEDQHTHIPVENYYAVDPEIQKFVDSTVKKKSVLDGLDSMWTRAKGLIKQDTEAEHAPIEELVIDDHIDDDDGDNPDTVEKEARRAWKEAHPSETIKKHRRMFETGIIDKLPWMHPDYHPDYQTQLIATADNIPQSGEVKGFGSQFPVNPSKGDMFLRVDRYPSALYKFNGRMWIEVDKTLSDQHAYDTAYIDYLIEKISTGEYDPDLLSEAEKYSIEQRLTNNPRGV
jgi:hypothetical protein